MATPLRTRDTMIKLPVWMSSLRGSALYLHLRKALNGFRHAYMEWINFLSESGPCALLVYVDDILVMAKSEKDVDLIFTIIEKHVTLKRTASHLGGGVILGRVISRRKGERSLLVSLPPDTLMVHSKIMDWLGTLGR